MISEDKCQSCYFVPMQQIFWEYKTGLIWITFIFCNVTLLYWILLGCTGVPKIVAAVSVAKVTAALLNIQT